MPRSKTPTYDALPQNVQRIIDTKAETPEDKENIAKRVTTTRKSYSTGTGH